MNQGQGTIKSLNDKGFGFIKVEGMPKDLFFHATALEGVRFDELQAGDEVVFDDIENSEKGMNATGVSLK